MEQYLDSKTEPEPPEDVSFEPYSIGYMFQTGNLFVEFGTFPEFGGFADQDAEWTDALYKWLALKRYLEHERKEGNADPFQEIACDADGAGDWSTMIEG